MFGEHQDYLGLEVIAAAINLRFYAKISRRDDNIVRIKIRDERINTLNQDNTEHLYEIKTIDLSKPITYDHNRDYLKSTVNLLLKKGYDLNGGFDIVMDSEIPIGKGMSSSSTMIDRTSASRSLRAFRTHQSRIASAALGRYRFPPLPNHP